MLGHILETAQCLSLRGKGSKRASCQSRPLALEDRRGGKRSDWRGEEGRWKRGEIRMNNDMFALGCPFAQVFR